MAYYKPQSPLIMNGKSIYPLTTADQVMLEDGSRLDAKYITTNITEADEGDAPFTNADQLGGINASNYALKSDIESNYALKSWVLDATHPIGSYYWSKDPTDPSILFGGTWEQIKDKFILAAGDSYAVNSTGGEETHTLTESEMPIHNHNMEYSTDNGSTWSTRSLGKDGTSESERYGGLSTSVTSYATYKSRIGFIGGGEAHNNMPPYLVAYCWCRTA